MQLCQNAGPVSRRELYGFEFSPPIGPHAQAELIRILVAPQERSGTFKIARHVVRIRQRERRGIEGDYANAGNAEYPLIAATP